MATRKLYDIDAYMTKFEGKVIACEEVGDVSGKDNGSEGNTDVQGCYKVILDQTLFFPEEGGQTPDKGTINGIAVTDVQIKGDEIIHYLEAPLEVGETVTGEIDWKHRFSNMQQHSGEHIFSGTAYKKYGYRNVGFHLSDQIVTMDFDHPFTEEQLAEMEWAVNEAIVANVEVVTGYPSKDVLSQIEYRSKIDFDEGVRIVEIKGYDVCACCAPHVHKTGEIGIFKIQSAQNYKGGMRISFLCGFRALEEYRNKAQIITKLSGILTTNQEQLAENVQKLKNQTQTLKNQLMTAKQTIMESKLESIPAEQKDVLLFETDLDTPVMRNVVNKLVEQHEGICGVFVGTDTGGYNYIIGSKTVDCREVASALKEKLGARGGGSTQMVQGSVQAKAEDIVECVK